MVNQYWYGMMGGLLAAFWGGYLLTAGILPTLRKSFSEAGFQRPNYAGQPIPVGLGTALWFGIFFTSVGLVVAGEWAPVPWRMVEDLLGLLFVSTGFFAVGLLDDLVGNRQATGLGGHLRRLFRQGEITTGLLKAAVGVAVGVFAAWLLNAEAWRWPVAGLLIALSANSVNLLDLRPGRACKGVLLMLLLVALFSLRGLQSPAFWLLLGATLAYLPDDLRARAMMGDAGSNLLGGSIGLLVVLTGSPAMILSWLGGLVLFHLFTERYSLTSVIENNKWLRWLDMFGRQAS